MKKVAIINQRYGLEVNGGSEQYTRMFAERLTGIYDVEVLTTCALEYTTWANYYTEGICNVNGVTVRRFEVGKQRNEKSFAKLNEQILLGNGCSEESEQKWIDEQGPYCPKCIEFIKENRDNYDAFIFVTYLYYLTVRGLEYVKDKAVLIPTAHDEPFICFKSYRNVFTSPRAIVFNTNEERQLVHSLFKNNDIPNDIVGVGIEIPSNTNPQFFKEKYNVQDYLLYAGRIDEGKNCKELFDCFAEYKKRNNSNLKLLLMGKAVIPIPEHEDIIPLGFVSDEDKFNGMAGAKALVLPSIFESLSIVVLESMGLGVPVVVNGRCDVLKGHCVKSNGGLYYNGYFEFEGCIKYLLRNAGAYAAMGISAKRYVEDNYKWDAVLKKLSDLISKL